MRAHTNGIELEYETIGAPDAEPLLLIMGFGMQLVQWPDGFVERVAARGYRVTRFDNRDVGLSTKLEGRYGLEDMADDTAGLLDALGVASAHIVGASMGGFIAQLLAIRHPERVRTLTSIMSTTGQPGVGGARQDLIPVLMAPPPTERAAFIESRLAIARLLTGSTHRSDETRVRTTVGRAFDRAFYPPGVARQFQAILAASDRTAALGALRVPALVIHGTDDILVAPSGGDATARAIPGARLLGIPGMGHDLPESVWDPIADAIAENARRAERSPKVA